MTTLTVSFHHTEVQMRVGDHTIHRGVWIMKKLREAGVPVIGELYPEGVIAGTLSMFNRQDEIVYEWVGDESFVKRAAGAAIYDNDDEI